MLYVIHVLSSIVISLVVFGICSLKIANMIKVIVSFNNESYTIVNYRNVYSKFALVDYSKLPNVNYCKHS